VVFLNVAGGAALASEVVSAAVHIAAYDVTQLNDEQQSVRRSVTSSVAKYLNAIWI